MDSIICIQKNLLLLFITKPIIDQVLTTVLWFCRVEATVTIPNVTADNLEAKLGVALRLLSSSGELLYQRIHYD
jgi:hypothetical protein